jgi:hypothetical protein
MITIELDFTPEDHKQLAALSRKNGLTKKAMLHKLLEQAGAKLDATKAENASKLSLESRLELLERDNKINDCRIDFCEQHKKEAKHMLAFVERKIAALESEINRVSAEQDIEKLGKTPPPDVSFS